RNRETRNGLVIAAPVVRRPGAPWGPRPSCRNQGRWRRASVFHPRCRRNTRMTFCPSDEELTGLLADALSTAERDALARHVEGCVACQDQLARLTGTFNTETWRRDPLARVPRHPLQGSEAEEGMMRRLKRMPPWLVSP